MTSSGGGFGVSEDFADLSFAGVTHDALHQSEPSSTPSSTVLPDIGEIGVNISGSRDGIRRILGFCRLVVGHR